MPLFTGEPIPAADPVLDPLNAEQHAAVTHRAGHLLVKAGPGTGKTLTLTHRIAWLIREGKAGDETDTRSHLYEKGGPGDGPPDRIPGREGSG